MSTDAVRGGAARAVESVAPVLAASGRPVSGPADGIPPGYGRRWTAVVAGFPALVMLICGLIGIGDRQLWRDEHATWWAATQVSTTDFVRLLSHIDIVFAPYYSYMRLWTAVFGDSAPALRLPSLLWMSVAAALLGLLGRRLYDAPTGLLAGLIFAILPTVSRYAAEARPYAQTLAVTIGATLLLLRALDRPRPRRWVWYALAVVAVGLSHLVALAVLVAHALLVLGEVRGQDRRIVVRRFRPWLLAVVVGLAPVVPVVFQARQQSHQIVWILPPEPLDLLRLPGELFGSRSVAIVLFFVALVGLAVSRWPSLALSAWILVAPALTYLTFDQFQLFYHRYLLFTVPAWVLLAAAGTLWMARLGQAAPVPDGRPVLRPALSVAAGALALALVAGYGLAGHRFVRSDLLEDEHAFRAAAGFVRTHAREGDGIAYSNYRYLRRAFAYELRHDPRPIDVFLDVPPAENGWYHAEECGRPARCLGDVRRIWWVSTRLGPDPLDREPGRIGDLLRDRFVVAQVVEFHKIWVLELVARE
ncbi:glycosyltransferase family 39 protein [Plantactinospora sp. B5E13]|uniref:glycosyltransferase family 39 protein n=1 Tax=Plantactinospora sp. B5E13 TaxID=3153758 RepID=UPI00325E23AF